MSMISIDQGDDMGSQHSETGSREQKIAIDSNNSFGNKIPQIEQVQAL